MKKIILIMLAAGSIFTSCKKDNIEKQKDVENIDNVIGDSVNINISMGTTARSAMQSINVECDCEIIQGNNMNRIMLVMKPGQKVKSTLIDKAHSYAPYMGAINYKVFVANRSKTEPVHQEFRNDLVFEYTHK